MMKSGDNFGNLYKHIRKENAKPYSQKKKNNVILRTFRKDVNEEDLVWHQDYKRRKIEVLEGNGWLFQNDNELPFELSPGQTFYVKDYHFHRLLKSPEKEITDLKIRIVEEL